MLSRALENTLHRAIEIANAHSHEMATLEHLLLVLTEDPDALSVLRGRSIKVSGLRDDLLQFIQKDLSSLMSDKDEDAVPSSSFQRVLQRAAIHVQSAGKDEVNGANILVAMYSERDSHAVYFLQKHGLSRYDVVHYLSHGEGKSGDSPEIVGFVESSGQGQKSPKSFLEKYCTNLNLKAREGAIDPVIGRSKQIERTMQVLCRRTKNNPLFVGEPGVGKTAIAEGLALRINQGTVPEILKDSVLYCLDLGALLAGARYRGDFEERLKGTLRELSKIKDTILFIDEIHNLVGSGSTSGAAMDASNLLKPALAKGGLRCMGATTYKEFTASFEKDRALARRFQKIDVPEPSRDHTIKILQGIKSKYEDHHSVTYTDDAIKSAVDLSMRYLNDRKLPDKAIDVIDEAGASQRLLSVESRKSVLDTPDIEGVIAKMAHVPSKRISQDDRSALQSLTRDLRAMVYGQDQAIVALTASIKLSRAGLREPEKSVGNYLFTGPTGVGKTEVAKQLAHILGVPLKRFDMSEYMERHTTSRLIGAPPGYVGHDQGGLLTDAVDQNPHCVVLLDELEKAHPDVFNLLLQVMDNGKLTDSNGKEVDFRNTIIIMTTNAGAAESAKPAVGFGNAMNTPASEAVINRTFSPEFRNRLDAIIAFNPLGMAEVNRVVDKFIMQLEAQLADRNVTITLSEKARNWIADKGFDPAMGARPLSRVIQEHVKKPLADQLLFGYLTTGGHVAIGLNKAGDTLTFRSKKETQKPKQKSPKTTEV